MLECTKINALDFCCKKYLCRGVYFRAEIKESLFILIIE